METLHTIENSYHELSNAHVDWSPTAGPIWLVTCLGLLAVGWIVLMVREA
jgi:uncharacterized membrane protein YozB (DUF420 family)